MKTTAQTIPLIIKTRRAQHAWKRIEEATSHVVDRQPRIDGDNQAEEEAIAESIKAFRQLNRHE